MGGCLSSRTSRNALTTVKNSDQIDQLASVIIREARRAAVSDSKHKPLHIQAAKDALKTARKKEPQNDDLAHLTAVVASLEEEKTETRPGVGGDLFADADELVTPPRHLHERLGLSHLQLRDINDPPSAHSAASSNSSVVSSDGVASSDGSSVADIIASAVVPSNEYEAFDPDSTHLLRLDDEADDTTVERSIAGSPRTVAKEQKEHVHDIDIIMPKAQKSPQWLIEQCQVLRKRLDAEKKERLKAEEKLNRAEVAASKLKEALMININKGDELNRVVSAPKKKVGASVSRGSNARQFKPNTPPSGRCVTSSYGEESSSSYKIPPLHAMQYLEYQQQQQFPKRPEDPTALSAEVKSFPSPSPIYYPGITPSIRDDGDAASSIMSSNSIAPQQWGHVQPPPNSKFRPFPSTSSEYQAGGYKVPSMTSVVTVNSQYLSPIASPLQPQMVDPRELGTYEERRTTDLTVRVMNGVSEEEIAKFLLPKRCFMSEKSFFVQLERLCQDHAGHPLTRLHWLRLTPTGMERRHVDSRMLNELISQPMAMPLYLSTVPMPSPAELVVFNPIIRLKSLVPAKITFTGRTISVPRVFLETTCLPDKNAYTIAFTDQWTSTTYIVEGFVAEDKCGVYFGIPNALLKKEAGGGSGLYDVHLLVNNTHRSDNRRALAVTSSDRALSSNASSASFEPVEGI